MSNRRTFLMQSGALAATALSARPGLAAPPEKVVLALIGSGGRGTGVIKGFTDLPGVEVAYICDPDAIRATLAAKVVGSSAGGSPKVVADFRRALDDKGVDAGLARTLRNIGNL